MDADSSDRDAQTGINPQGVAYSPGFGVAIGGSGIYRLGSAQAPADSPWTVSARFESATIGSGWNLVNIGEWGKPWEAILVFDGDCVDGFLSVVGVGLAQSDSRGPVQPRNGPELRCQRIARRAAVSPPDDVSRRQ